MASGLLSPSPPVCHGEMVLYPACPATSWALEAWSRPTRLQWGSENIRELVVRFNNRSQPDLFLLYLTILYARRHTGSLENLIMFNLWPTVSPLTHKNTISFFFLLFFFERKKLQLIKKERDRVQAGGFSSPLCCKDVVTEDHSFLILVGFHDLIVTKSGARWRRLILPTS